MTKYSAMGDHETELAGQAQAAAEACRLPDGPVREAVIQQHYADMDRHIAAAESWYRRV